MLLTPRFCGCKVLQKKSIAKEKGIMMKIG